MASLYQRFSGKINTSRSFPVPPEASHLLGAQSSEEDGAAGKTSRPLQQESSRPRFQYQPRSDCEEEDVSAGVVRVGLSWVLGVPPFPPPPPPSRPVGCLCAPLRLAAISCDLAALPSGVFALLFFPRSAGDGTGRSPHGAEPNRGSPAPALPPHLSPRYLAPCAALRCRGAGLGGGGRGVSTFGNSKCKLPLFPSKRGNKAPPPPTFFFFSIFYCYSLFYPLTLPRGKSLHLVPPSLASLPQPGSGQTF